MCLFCFSPNLFFFLHHKGAGICRVGKHGNAKNVPEGSATFTQELGFAQLPCSWSTYKLPALVISFRTFSSLVWFLHIQVIHRCLWSALVRAHQCLRCGAEPAQLIYSRAMLKGHAAWRTPAPELINLPQPICDGVGRGVSGGRSREL